MQKGAHFQQISAENLKKHSFTQFYAKTVLKCARGCAKIADFQKSASHF